MPTSLPRTITVDNDKCVNCHACITACPVKFCNDGSSKEHVEIDVDMCIGCGNCIKACTHKARIYVDDFEQFMEAIQNQEKIIAIAAPAMAANFPRHYLNLNGWLKSIGVEAIFDVSFGAELTIKSYTEYLKNNSPDILIAQPCPAIVTYIQIYRPELIKFLAPADSPMIHTMKMVKEFYPEYAHHKIAVISPCMAKKREFAETGFGDFNVTYKSLDNYFQKNEIQISNYVSEEFSNKSAERAVLFSSPGGLMRTANREVKDIIFRTRKIEGPEIVYKYLDKLSEMIEKKMNPLLIDCLSCEMGCNGGPGTLNQEKSPDEIEFLIEERKKEVQLKYNKKGLLSKFRTKRLLSKTINSYWKPELYQRIYNDLSDNNKIKNPTPLEQQKIFESMEKFSDSDIFNCSSCGYGNCEDMAKAIHNGLNNPENCHFYKNNLIKKALQEAEEMHKLVGEKHQIISESLKQTEEMKGLLEIRHKHILQMTKNLAVAVKEMDIGNNSICRMTGQLLERSENQIDEFKNLEAELTNFTRRTAQFNQIVDVINYTAERINLLSMNASIESARAGKFGSRFAVVAAEVKELALKAQSEGKKIIPFIEEIKREFQKISTLMLKMASEFDNTSKLIVEVTAATEQMSNSMHNINEQTVTLVKDEKY